MPWPESLPALSGCVPSTLFAVPSFSAASSLPSHVASSSIEDTCCSPAQGLLQTLLWGASHLPSFAPAHLRWQPSPPCKWVYADKRGAGHPASTGATSSPALPSSPATCFRDEVLEAQPAGWVSDSPRNSGSCIVALTHPAHTQTLQTGSISNSWGVPSPFVCLFFLGSEQVGRVPKNGCSEGPAWRCKRWRCMSDPHTIHRFSPTVRQKCSLPSKTIESLLWVCSSRKPLLFFIH